MLKTLTVLGIAAILLAAPSFCLGGVVEHACDGHEEEEVCGHEENCPDDPCAEAFAPPRDDVNAPADLGSLVLLAGSADGTAKAVCPVGADSPEVRKRLPIPPSDLPLLI